MHGLREMGSWFNPWMGGGRVSTLGDIVLPAPLKATTGEYNPNVTSICLFSSLLFCTLNY